MRESSQYIQNIQHLIARVTVTQLDNIETAAQAVAHALMGGRRIFTFGSGHSHMLAEELFYRAGGLANIHPILQDALMLHASASGSTAMERLEGLGTLLAAQYRPETGDVLIVASNSGRNAVPVELALAAREAGAYVIALTSLAHTRAVSSRHGSGKRLFEVADVVLDNAGCVGDACVTIGELKTSPTSTVIGALILNAVSARAVGILCNKNVAPEVFLSSNADGGDNHNQRLVEKYRGEVKCL